MAKNLSRLATRLLLRQFRKKGLFQAVGLDWPPNLFLKLERTRFINPVSTGVFFLTGPRHQHTVNSFQTGETAKKNGSKRGLWRV